MSHTAPLNHDDDHQDLIEDREDLIEDRHDETEVSQDHAAREEAFRHSVAWLPLELCSLQTGKPKSIRLLPFWQLVKKSAF